MLCKIPPCSTQGGDHDEPYINVDERMVYQFFQRLKAVRQHEMHSVISFSVIFVIISPLTRAGNLLWLQKAIRTCSKEHKEIK